MSDLLVEIEHIQNHFPEFVMAFIPKLLIGLLVLQAVSGLVQFMLRKSETGKAQEAKATITTISVILWLIMVVLLGVDLYYYILSVREM